MSTPHPNPGSVAAGAAGQADPSLDEQRPILITGTTGFVGMEVLARFLQGSRRHIFALIRAKDDAEAQTRLRSVLAEDVRQPRRPSRPRERGGGRHRAARPRPATRPSR